MTKPLPVLPAAPAITAGCAAAAFAAGRAAVELAAAVKFTESITVPSIVCMTEEALGLTDVAHTNDFLPLTYSISNTQVKGCNIGTRLLVRLLADKKSRIPGGYVVAMVEVIRKHFDHQHAFDENVMKYGLEFAKWKFNRVLAKQTVTLHLRVVCFFLNDSNRIPRVPTNTLRGTIVSTPVTPEVRKSARSTSTAHRAMMRTALMNLGH